MRLDVLLVERGLFPSREAAKRAIMAGLVRREGDVLDKPGTFVRPDAVVEVAQPEHAFVSRGGLKLERALARFGVSADQRVVVDVGASTGGFTDCVLRHGAKHVYAVDVGYGQLDWKLRNDPRVTVMERTNFRHVDAALFSPPPSLAVMDVSFISTRLLLPKLQEILQPPGDIISLIKPQFEAGRGKVGKGGIVRDPQVHTDVICQLLSFLPTVGLECAGLDYSPVAGGDGNIEFLGWWRPARTTDAEAVEAWRDRAVQVVREAWLEIRGEEVVPLRK
ncbi:TlyA family RNA methyltransferase [Alicyclobacillus cycloheptanicus]|uniref:23S rRNA (Cytidine1920-2'-O)/16S rRNA (Cytidine1409-2'-O)-methyltransferase n=1 Tax=Alicyclobacillus cycloheptanicus TaxID=1457 RepID=A0ABT9XF53_9BACL|nr:TlyA family RNA methyltransferase [Alicyclobacillus cycloheptanicus]MDQ0188371.1 23S rRNA (cytidine1920-2'-O)/16S rRNA (cytidine1409-2'-O)-methyltransferase [Alicyclobacillus cycloheptanicus]